MSMAACTLVEEHDGHGALSILLERVCATCRAVRAGQLDFSELHDIIMQLEKFILSGDQDEAAAARALEGLSREAVARLNHAYAFWEHHLETQLANRMIQGAADISEFPLYERFAALVRSELALISNSRPRRILFVGSGPLPLSAVLIHRLTGSAMDCVGRDAHSAAVSRQVLEQCAIHGAVRVLCEMQAGYPVSEYDLVFIDLHAKPRKAILRTLRKRGRPGCQVLCRTAHGVRQLVYEPAADHDMRGFHRKGQHIAHGPQTVSTYLLEAASSAAEDVRLEWLQSIDSQTAAQILLLMNRTLEEETTIGFPGPLDEETGYALLQKLSAEVESGHRHVLVAYKGSAIVGQLILTPNSSPNHRHIVELTRGTIDRSFRGGGLAFRAFHEVARKCETLGREVICLDVRAGTHAAIWWQHFGFKPYGLLADYSRVGDKRYQGLYLTQTTAELKLRLTELAGSSMTRSELVPEAV